MVGCQGARRMGEWGDKGGGGREEEVGERDKGRRTGERVCEPLRGSAVC